MTRVQHSNAGRSGNDFIDSRPGRTRCSFSVIFLIRLFDRLLLGIADAIEKFREWVKFDSVRSNSKE